MNIILMGVQGSGKGTQAKLLREKFDWDHVTTGELLRCNISKQTELGKIAQGYMDKGELVPDKYVFRIVKDALSEKKQGFILDGFPRNKEQLDFLLQNFKIDCAVLLKLTDAKAIERLLARRVCSNCKKEYNVLFNKPQQEGICDVCGGEIIKRADDNETAINKRIEKYHIETKRVIDYFSGIEKLFEIEADQSVSQVHQDIVEALK